jgi:hypothetical protein
LTLPTFSEHIEAQDISERLDENNNRRVSKRSRVRRVRRLSFDTIQHRHGHFGSSSNGHRTSLLYKVAKAEFQIGTPFAFGWRADNPGEI